MKQDKIKDEKTLISRVYEELNNNKPYRLKKLYKFVNLANKNFENIWSGWYKGQTPPKLEVDIILAFEDSQKVVDKALIIGVEVKYFKDFRGFYKGLGQILSYSVFGFDGLSLWHLFSKDVEDNKIQIFAKATEEVIKGFNLPIFYLCGRIIDEEELKLKSFAPIGNIEGNIKYFVDLMRNHITDRNNRNALLFESKPFGPNSKEIKRRRNILKIILEIP